MDVPDAHTHTPHNTHPPKHTHTHTHTHTPKHTHTHTHTHAHNSAGPCFGIHLLHPFHPLSFPVLVKTQPLQTLCSL